MKALISTRETQVLHLIANEYAMNEIADLHAFIDGCGNLLKGEKEEVEEK